MRLLVVGVEREVEVSGKVVVRGRRRVRRVGRRRR